MLARLHGWRLASIEMVGTAPLPGGVTHVHEAWGQRPPKKTPVLASDHFGLLAKLVPA